MNSALSWIFQQTLHVVYLFFYNLEYLENYAAWVTYLIVVALLVSLASLLKRQQTVVRFDFYVLESLEELDALLKKG
jgi:hypothetical protein